MHEKFIKYEAKGVHVRVYNNIINCLKNCLWAMNLHLCIEKGWILDAKETEEFVFLFQITL